MKLKRFFSRGFPAKRVRIPFAVKTAAIYTLLFSGILVAAVAGLTGAYTAHAVRARELDRLASFVADHFDRPPGGVPDPLRQPPQGLGSIAQLNRVYIEIRDEKTGGVTSYGDKKIDGDGRLQSLRRSGAPGRRRMIRVVSAENAAFAGMPFAGFAALIALLVLASAVFGGLLIRRMMRPVFDLTKAARSIGANDLSTRIKTVDSHDELQDLADTFNGMLDRIQESYEQQNRFVSDASHELRTPLSVVSGYANLLRRWGSGDPAVLREAVGKIIEETDGMQQLVERLLFLARADRKTQRVRFETVDASELMEEIAEETRMIDGEHALQTEIARDVTLTADRALLKQAVRAIVDNSIKYTPPGGAIRLGCRERGGFAELEVSDTGVGIAAKDLPHIFDRFYKADGARTRGKGSSGLGLSIAKWIAERHGGTIRVESAPGNGTDFRIRLPRARFPGLPG
mgnify:CR=1 FL=1